jgi:hypothetical protein
LGEHRTYGRAQISTAPTAESALEPPNWAALLYPDGWKNGGSIALRLFGCNEPGQDGELLSVNDYFDSLSLLFAVVVTRVLHISDILPALMATQRETGERKSQ